MTTFTYAQLESLWINNGGSSATAPVAAAIALAESSGNSLNVNATDNNGKQTSWGLWQISNGTHSQPAANILDPNVNAQQAVAKYKAAGNSFSPWGTYNSGAYKADLSTGTTPDPNVPATTAQVTAATAQASPSICVIPYPTINVVVTSVGGGCLITKSQARGVIGGLLLMTAIPLVLAGAVILAAAGFERSGGARAVAEATPGVRRIVRATGGLAGPTPQERQNAGYEEGIQRRERSVRERERVNRLQARERRLNAPPKTPKPKAAPKPKKAPAAKKAAAKSPESSDSSGA